MCLLSIALINRMSRGLLGRKAAAAARAARHAHHMATAVILQKYVRRMLARKWGKKAIAQARAQAAAAVKIQVRV